MSARWPTTLLGHFENTSGAGGARRPPRRRARDSSGRSRPPCRVAGPGRAAPRPRAVRPATPTARRSCRRRRRGRGKVAKLFRSACEELGHRSRAAGDDLRGRPPRLPDDDPEGLTGRGSGGNEAHVGSRVVQYSGRWTEDWTIRYGDRRVNTAWSAAMAFDPVEQVPLGQTGLAVTRLGFGGASIGGLFAAGRRRRRDRHAPPCLGPRNPLLRHRPAVRLRERRSGESAPRSATSPQTRTCSRRRSAASSAIRPRSGPATRSIRQRLRDADDAFYVRSGAERLVFDYSADGVRRSLEESLERLGLDRIDIALIHDPDDHWQAAIDGAVPGPRAPSRGGRHPGRRRRDEPVGDARTVRSARPTSTSCWSPGATRSSTRVRSTSLLPTCDARGVAVLVGGVMNSGVLASPGNREPVQLRAGAAGRGRSRAADRRGLRAPRRAAAGGRRPVPTRPPAVVSLVTGVRSVVHLDEYPDSPVARSRPDAWTGAPRRGRSSRRTPRCRPHRPVRTAT